MDICNKSTVTCLQAGNDVDDIQDWPLMADCFMWARLHDPRLTADVRSTIFVNN